MRSPRLARRIVLPVLAALLAFAAPGSLRAARTPAAAAPPRTATLAGTVNASNASARTFDLLTGVGHALRVIRIHAPVGSAARGAAALPALPARGSIVRVECTHTAAGYQATRIEIVAPAPARTP